jgi:hypothetical protein
LQTPWTVEAQCCEKILGREGVAINLSGLDFMIIKKRFLFGTPKGSGYNINTI